MNDEHWLLAVDGGGSHCRVRLCNKNGTVLGEGSAGSANARLGADVVFKEILTATERALKQAKLTSSILNKTYVGLGLAGAVSPSLNDSIKHYPHPFAALKLENDAVIACLGAHRAQTGAIVIFGTGSCAVINHTDKRQQQFQTIGGWGLGISDQGSGAKLGLDFVRAAVSGFEGITQSSPLTDRFMQTFNNSPLAVFQWCEQAKPKQYGSLVPMIIEHFQQADAIACQLINSSINEASMLITRTIELSSSKICLMGGYAQFIAPLLNNEVKQHISPALGDALDGGIYLARHSYLNRHQ
ncbi:BadF/BadG/BcrA/BcrD ATPase family protein [Gammaproteobacteria bacterium AS21]|jgi:glucosamine kinase